MKNVLVGIGLLTMTSAHGQMVVSKQSTHNSSVSLDFADYESRGLILPYVEQKANITENGTLIFDMLDKKVKYLKNNAWFDLSVNSSGKVDPGLEIGGTEVQNAKVSIGKQTAVDGVLVLEDADKAMVLPRVAEPHLNIINPSAGMIVYDTTNKLLAVYNGTVWSFWGPKLAP